MKKSEMEEHYARYNDHISQAKAAERSDDYRAALKHAISSLRHIDGMMRYSQKYLDYEFESVAAIDCILRYAPLLFDRDGLIALADVLKEQKRIDRQTEVDLANRLKDAHSRMLQNHRLWSHIDSGNDVRQSAIRGELGGDQTYWRSTAELWERMGLIRRLPEGPSYSLSFATRFGEITRGKCSACGETAEAPKAMFLQETKCMTCGDEVLFVVLGHDASDSMEG